MNVPEKIYVCMPDDDIVGTASTQKGFPNQFMKEEYTHTDAFIEKACEWLKDNIYHRVYECGDRLGFPTANFIDEFRKYMKGE